MEQRKGDHRAHTFGFYGRLKLSPKHAEISVCRLWMAVQSLWMAIQKLRMCIRSLQTEISLLLRENFYLNPGIINQNKVHDNGISYLVFLYFCSRIETFLSKTYEKKEEELCTSCI